MSDTNRFLVILIYTLCLEQLSHSKIHDFTLAACIAIAPHACTRHRYACINPQGARTARLSVKQQCCKLCGLITFKKWWEAPLLNIGKRQ